MQFTNSRSFIAVILGALLVAALFFFYGKPSEQGSEVPLKPSQFDFTQGNEPQPLPAETSEISVSTTMPEKKTEQPESFKKLSAQDAAKIQTLDEILKSKNDNDPRMDQQLKVMSPALHEALYDKYQMMSAEDRNGRGTVTFLIARDLKSAEDAEFLKQVFNESPCTSMASCNQVSQEDSHLGGIEQNSLNYPQLATLYQIESRLEKNPNLAKDPQFRGWVSEILRQAKRFPVPVVQEKAEEISTKYGL